MRAAVILPVKPSLSWRPSWALARGNAGSQTADCADGRTGGWTAAGGGSDQRNHYMRQQPTFQQATFSCPPRHMVAHAGGTATAKEGLGG